MPATSAPPLTVRQVLSVYFELSKPRITLLLLVVAVASYFVVAQGAWSWYGVFVVAASVGTLGTGIFALNHYMERGNDKLMMRTEKRPLPSGKLKPANALTFGLAFTVLGIASSALLANVLTGAIAAFVAVSYLLVYTPLKYKTAFHTALGAFPGAAPPLAGWAVATGGLDVDAWILFGILFLWQFPHFLAIEMIYRDDYAKADIRVLPVVDKTGAAVAFQVVGSLVALIVVSVLPLWTGLADVRYAASAAVLGAAFLVFGARAVATKKKMDAKYLLRASVLYLPLVFVALLVFRT